MDGESGPPNLSGFIVGIFLVPANLRSGLRGGVRAGKKNEGRKRDDDDDDSLLHIFALKMNYNMFTLAIRKNIKIYTF